MSRPLPAAEPLTAVELDRRLDEAVRDHERAEKLICVYLSQLSRRGLYSEFGFENVYDYALERFGFCRSKTRALLYLGRRLTRLPKLTEALATGRLGWTKAAKVASVATAETEDEWTEKAVASSYRELEREIRDGVSPTGGRVSIYLTREQAAVWTQALELCRRVSGEEIDAGLALEYVAGEFLATYQASVNEAEEADDAPGSLEAEGDIEAERELAMCPEGEESRGDVLPVVSAKPYAVTHREVLERDGYRCRYPGCSVRAGLHVHHIERRSAFGSRGVDAMNAPTNLVTLCWFHHRMLHAGLIGVTGRAPAELAWTRPSVMESVSERHEVMVGLDELPLGEVAGGVGLPNVWQGARSGGDGWSAGREPM